MGAKQPGGGKWPRADRLLSGTQSGEADVLLLRVARFLRQCGATFSFERENDRYSALRRNYGAYACRRSSREFACAASQRR